MSVPNTPDNLQVSTSNYALTLQWSDADGGSSSVITYTIRQLTPFTQNFPNISENLTAYTVTNLLPGIEYSFSLTANNANGSSPPATLTGTPSRPVNTPGIIDTFNCLAANSGVVVNFSAPSVGLPIKRYIVVQISPNYLIYNFNKNGHDHYIGNLNNGTSYTFYVAAVNSAGIGTLSESKSATPLVTNHPSPPIINFEPIRTHNQLTYNWITPSNIGNTPLVEFQLVVTPSDTNTPETISIPIVPNQTHYSYVRAVTFGVNYNTSVTARNASLESSSNQFYSATPLEVGQSLVSVNIVDKNPVPENGKLNFTWETIQEIFNYYLSNYNDPSIGFYLEPFSITYKLENLTNGQTYRYQIAAINLYGTGPVNIYNSAIPGRPSVPKNPSIQIGLYLLTLSWEAPESDSGSPLTGYTLNQLTPITQTFPISIGTTTYTVNKLLPQIEYTFSLTANNANGSSAPANFSGTPNPDSGAPSVSISGYQDPTVRNSGLTFDFVPTISSPNPVLRYVIIQKSPNFIIYSDVKKNPYSISNLTNGTTYSFSIAAINAIGIGDFADYNVATPAYSDDRTSLPILFYDPVSGNQTLTFNWITPVNTGNSTLKEFTITNNSIENVISAVIPAVPGQKYYTHTFNGLTNDNTYTLFIHAINNNETGFYDSQSFNPAKPSFTFVPSMPVVANQNPKAYDSRLEFSWAEPTTGPPTNYYLSNYDIPSSGFYLQTVDSPHSVLNLINGQSYIYQIFATNSEYTGPAAIYEAAKPGTPSAPIIASSLNPVFVGTTVTFNWLAPDNGGFTITGYKLTNITDNVTTSIGNVLTYNISGLTIGNQYSFKISAENINGEGPTNLYNTFTVPITTPGPPNITAAPTVGDTTLTLRWTAPDSDGGDAIIRYKLSGNNGFTTISLSANQSPFTVTNLLNGTSYIFTILAVNNAGDGTASTYDAATPISSITKPDPPTISGSPIVGDQSLTLNWTAPTITGGSAISGYKITDTGSSGFSSYPGPNDTSATITGLTNGTPYTFQIVASNSSLDSDAISFASATPATVPTTVDIAANIDPTVGNGNLTFKWSPPDDGGSIILNYYLTDGNQIQLTVGPSFREATISGLTNGTSYTFMINAINSIGPGTAVSYNSATPLAVAPDPPNISSSINPTVGNQQLTFNWAEPTNNGGSAVTKYILSGFGTNIEFANNVFEHVQTNLDNGTSYNISIVAENGVGQSSPANFNPATPATVPDPPTSVETTPVPGINSLQIFFDKPINDGGSAITKLRVFDSNHSLNEDIPANAPSPYTISGLSYLNVYQLQLVAVNIIGESTSLQYGAMSPTEPTPGTTVPSAPIILQYLNPTIGDRRLTFDWEPPTNDGGTQILNYRLFDDANGISSPVSDPTSRQFVIENLQNGTTYNFSIVANNSVGESIPAVYNSRAPSTVPGFPNITQNPTPGDQRLTLSWAAPANNGGSTITRYILSGDQGFTTIPNLSLGDSPYTVTGLTNGTTYTFSLIAVNINGNGAPSTYDPASPSNKPSAPIISASPDPVAGPGKLTFSWAEPTSNGGSSITGYKLTNVSTSISSSFNNPSLRTAIISNLPNTSVVFSIVAINANGDGASVSYNAVTPELANAPGSPIITSAPTVGNNRLTFSWTAPTDDGGSTITSYTLSGNNGVASIPNLSLSDSPKTVDGLTNGTPYIFNLVAINSRGSGSVAEYNEATPIASSSPSIPRLIGANIRPLVTSTTATLYWDPPLSGAPIISYRYFVNGVGTTITLPAPNFVTITGLTTGTIYNFGIAATNSSGTSDTALYRIVQLGNKPTIPQSLTITNVTSTSAQLNWTAPTSDGGSTIKWYVIVPTSSDPNDTYTAYNSSATTIDSSYGRYGKKCIEGYQTSIVMKYLTPGNTYTFGIHAVNDAGYSPIKLST